MGFNIEELSKRASALQQTANELISRQSGLDSIENAKKWKSEALSLKKMITTFKNDLANCRHEEEKLLINTETELSELPFFKRLTASKTEINKHKDNIDNLDDGLKSVDDSLHILAKTIDKIPTSINEVESQISRLSIRKKELIVEKREVNEEIRRIRTKARQDRAEWAGVHGKYVGSIATTARARITQAEEKNLTPFETHKGEIEYELIDIEKKMNWLGGFKSGDTSSFEEKNYKCAYCGRSVNPGEVCPGCGSDQTIIEFN